MTNINAIVSSSRTVIVFGASDPESIAAKKLASSWGWIVLTASAGGKPVHGGNAYKGDGVLEPHTPQDGDTILFFECGFSGGDWAGVTPSVRFDHHNPGDKGYGAAPRDFFLGSSLGQLIAYHAQRDGSSSLGFPGEGYVDWTAPANDATIQFCSPEWGYGVTTPEIVDGLGVVIPIPQELTLIAAADHCLSHAYQGKCPGVSPEALWEFRMAAKAAFLKRDPHEFLAEVNSATERVLGLTPTNGVLDLRGQNVPELPEIASRYGLVYISDVTEPTGRKKCVLGGAASPELVSRFMAGEVVSGLVEHYGVPARGFAGGYYPS